MLTSFFGLARNADDTGMLEMLVYFLWPSGFRTTATGIQEVREVESAQAVAHGRPASD